MLLLLICILFNSYIGVVFKYFEKFEVRTLQAIIINYFVCAITASVMIGKPAVTLEILDKDWLWAAVALGFTFVIVFYLFALSVQKFGVVVASIFQKMSLIAPALIAISFYNESAGGMKIIGIILAILSILVISYSKSSNKSSSKDDTKTNLLLWIFPIGTFVGSCLIDSGLFYVNKTGLASSLDIDFIATLFFFAGVFGLFLVLIDYIKNKTTFRKKEFIAGIALGVPNFFSIYLLLKVLANGMDASVVFPINNVGILLATALFGLFLFKEKFSTQKIIGFAMAVLAIALIAMG